MYTFENKEQLTAFIHEEVITSSEALQILGCSRQNLNKLINKGTITPIKELPRERLFFKKDILQRKEALEKKSK